MSSGRSSSRKHNYNMVSLYLYIVVGYSKNVAFKKRKERRFVFLTMELKTS